MQPNLFRLLPWLLISVALMFAAVITQQAAPGNVLAVSLYKAHLLSLGGWAGYWLDRGLFPYSRPHECILPVHEDTLESLSGMAHDGDMADAELAAVSSIFELAMIRRAIIVAAALICVGLGA